MGRSMSLLSNSSMSRTPAARTAAGRCPAGPGGRSPRSGGGTFRPGRLPGRAERRAGRWGGRPGVAEQRQGTADGVVLVQPGAQGAAGGDAPAKHTAEAQFAGDEAGEGEPADAGTARDEQRPVQQQGRVDQIDVVRVLPGGGTAHGGGEGADRVHDGEQAGDLVGHQAGDGHAESGGGSPVHGGPLNAPEATAGAAAGVACGAGGVAWAGTAAVAVGAVEDAGLPTGAEVVDHFGRCSQPDAGADRVPPLGEQGPHLADGEGDVERSTPAGAGPSRRGRGRWRPGSGACGRGGLGQVRVDAAAWAAASA